MDTRVPAADALNLHPSPPDRVQVVSDRVQVGWKGDSASADNTFGLADHTSNEVPSTALGRKDLGQDTMDPSMASVSQNMTSSYFDDLYPSELDGWYPEGL